MKKAKIVKTFDFNNKENGYLIELQKDGNLTTAYMTVAYPGTFKGYHLHKVRAANYTCIRGKIDVILYTSAGREVYTLQQGDQLHIPRNIPTGLSNNYNEESWIINHPNPAYDPDLKDEQIDYTLEEVSKLSLLELE